MTTTSITELIRTTQTAEERRAQARVPLEKPRTLFGRAVAWYSKRTFGEVVDNGLAMMHNPPVLKAVLGFERRVDKWDRLDPDLKLLAQAGSAAMIGCSWCMDFGYYLAHSQGMDLHKLREILRWRESDVFDDLERAVLEYTEAMTATPPTVTDELAERLRGELGNAGFVELTMMIAVENERSRFNSALGLSSQGFSNKCDLPDD
jgi:AhpD family alkylhydroperoxidase